FAIRSYQIALQQTDRILPLNFGEIQIPAACPQLRTRRTLGTLTASAARVPAYRQPEESKTGQIPSRYQITRSSYGCKGRLPEQGPQLPFHRARLFDQLHMPSLHSVEKEK